MKLNGVWMLIGLVLYLVTMFSHPLAWYDVTLTGFAVSMGWAFVWNNDMKHTKTVWTLNPNK